MMQFSFKEGLYDDKGKTLIREYADGVCLVENLPDEATGCPMTSKHLQDDKYRTVMHLNSWILSRLLQVDLMVTDNVIFKVGHLLRFLQGPNAQNEFKASGLDIKNLYIFIVGEPLLEDNRLSVKPLYAIDDMNPMRKSDIRLNIANDQIQIVPLSDMEEEILHIHKVGEEYYDRPEVEYIYGKRNFLRPLMIFRYDGKEWLNQIYYVNKKMAIVKYVSLGYDCSTNEITIPCGDHRIRMVVDGSDANMKFIPVNETNEDIITLPHNISITSVEIKEGWEATGKMTDVPFTLHALKFGNKSQYKLTYTPTKNIVTVAITAMPAICGMISFGEDMVLENFLLTTGQCISIPVNVTGGLNQSDVVSEIKIDKDKVHFYRGLFDAHEECFHWDRCQIENIRFDDENCGKEYIDVTVNDTYQKPYRYMMFKFLPGAVVAKVKYPGKGCSYITNMLEDCYYVDGCNKTLRESELPKISGDVPNPGQFMKPETFEAFDVKPGDSHVYTSYVYTYDTARYSFDLPLKGHYKFGPGSVNMISAHRIEAYLMSDTGIQLKKLLVDHCEYIQSYYKGDPCVMSIHLMSIPRSDMEDASFVRIVIPEGIMVLREDDYKLIPNELQEFTFNKSGACVSTSAAMGIVDHKEPTIPESHLDLTNPENCTFSAKAIYEKDGHASVTAMLEIYNRDDVIYDFSGLEIKDFVIGINGFIPAKVTGRSYHQVNGRENFQNPDTKALKRVTYRYIITLQLENLLTPGQINGVLLDIPGQTVTQRSKTKEGAISYIKPQVLKASI